MTWLLPKYKAYRYSTGAGGTSPGSPPGQPLLCSFPRGAPSRPASADAMPRFRHSFLLPSPPCPPAVHRPRRWDPQGAWPLTTQAEHNPPSQRRAWPAIQLEPIRQSSEGIHPQSWQSVAMAIQSSSLPIQSNGYAATILGWRVRPQGGGLMSVRRRLWVASAGKGVG